MGTTAKGNTGTDFPKCPTGTHVARCYQVIDLGHQKTVWQGAEKWVHKILLSWELLGDEKMNDGRPWSVSSRYTLSLSAKGQLAPMLESWRGKPFTVSERDGFDVKNVLGAYCLINVVHSTVGDKTYTNVAGVMPLPKGMAKPAAINPNVYFDLDTDDLGTLPQWIQTIIMKSKEVTEPDGDTHEPSSNGQFADLEEPIPF